MNEQDSPSTDDRPGLLKLIREDWITHGRDWSKPGFRAMLMYRVGVWRMGVGSRLLRAPLSVLYRFMHRWVRNRYGIELHYTAKIGRRLLIAHQGAIVIHEHAVIGDDCIVRQGVTLGAAASYGAEQAPKLGDRVSVGAGAMVLGRVTVGDDARIGPNAVVMANVPAGATATAAPARIIQPPRADNPDKEAA
ncbi:MAG: serine acetyltransferase [Phycisphaerales bacterium]|nr:MAG: serine acetyltransferase [Phycisphaerales bacterium]